jgi:hypothetical protein
MTTAKWTIDTGEHSRILPCPAARFNEKECLLAWGGDALKRAFRQFHSVWTYNTMHELLNIE